MVNHPNRSKRTPRFTPGPWQAREIPGGGNKTAAFWIDSRAVHREKFIAGTVAEVLKTGYGPGSPAANAALIAAAPDLYEAMDDLIEIVESAIDAGLFKSVDGLRHEVQALHIARMTLAKARGET